MSFQSTYLHELLVFLATFSINSFLNNTAKAPELTPVKEVIVPELKTAFPRETEATVKDMAHQMQRA
ncbi:hypothetical protein [Selenomonas ruminantium]|uniref:hypothetical protein n=1 Tax=Selenomonas ruminantium TaxID=971 RepID=UPI0009445606|nr:hypothetical protein [Selenomonas ruminantium]